MACYVYGTRIADRHLWPPRTRTRHPYEFSCGPLCVRCGIPLGTVQYETADDAHAERTGHHLASGTCEETCGDRPWWEKEPMNGAEAAELQAARTPTDSTSTTQPTKENQ
jgi:hypothetical protein